MQQDTPATLSPDGRWRWDGTQWVQAAAPAPSPATLSPDGRSSWDGTQWVATAVPAPAPAALSPDGRWGWDGTQWIPVGPPAPQTRQAQARVGALACQVCGAQPAAAMVLRQHMGFAVFWMNRRFRLVCCRDCGLAFFRQKQNLTLLTGWWGLASGLILNWVTIIFNLVQRGTATRLPVPVRPAGGIPLDPGRPVYLRPGMVLACIAAMLLIVVLVIAVTSGG